MTDGYQKKSKVFKTTLWELFSLVGVTATAISYPVSQPFGLLAF